MRIISFFVPGDPVGKARPRVVDGHAYTPGKTKAYEQEIRLAYKQFAKGRCDKLAKFDKDEAIALYVTCYYRIPKSASKAKKARMMSWEEKPRKKPDLDNVLKIVADALNGYAYYDDCQIVIMGANKRYAEAPGIQVEVIEVLV